MFMCEIPNTEVKPLRADDTVWRTLRGRVDAAGFNLTNEPARGPSGLSFFGAMDENSLPWTLKLGQIFSWGVWA
jgi:hypothetical protein